MILAISILMWFLITFPPIAGEAYVGSFITYQGGRLLGLGALPQKSEFSLGYGQYHRAVAGGSAIGF